mmetsp:Transcript_28056/g.51223  ORF Transcript_28056/g.51223 Transcript_28056/m.51223 type:complete len:221 (+) Transcript_28056:91-753(+)
MASSNLADGAVRLAPSPPPMAPAAPPAAGGQASGPAQAEAPGRPSFRVVDMVKNAGHPVVCIFTGLFKIIVLFVYIVGRYFSSSYVTTFIMTTIFAALDFWTVKNVSGRILVGLRWWNHVTEDGSSEWVFECNPDESSMDATDRTIFWTLVYVWPLWWIVALFANVFSFDIKWVILDFMIFVFAASNLAGYWKCSKDAKRQASEWIQRQGVRAVVSGMGF